MEYDLKTILEKIILPVEDGWKLSKLDINEEKLEVNVYLYFEPNNYKVGSLEYDLYDARVERKWRHLDLWQYKTFIYCKLPRYKDENNKVKTIDVPWSEPYERMTWLLEKKTLDTLHCTKSQSKTGRLLGLSFDQVHRVMNNFVDRGMSKRSLDERYYYLSIDEKAVSRGHDYFSILSDESTGVVIDVVEGRTKESVDRLCNKLSKDQRDDVKTICTDMWDAFIYGAKTHFEKAIHCHDNFHLVGYLNKAVDKVRKREVREVEELKKTKYIWLKDVSNMTEKQRIIFNSIDKVNYEVAKAWRIKENFRDIQFRQETKENAFFILANWRRSAIYSKIPEILEVVKMFDRHFQGILNAILTGSNNARAERINGAIEELKRIGRGYRNKQNFRTAILFFHGDLDGYSHKTQ